MKTFLCALTLALGVSQNVLAEEPADALIRADNAREGDLATKAVQYFNTLKYTKCDNEKPSHVYITKVRSYSIAQDKGSDVFEYRADYLVQRSCYFTSTFAGLGRDLNDAVIIQARRFGTIKAQHAITPSIPDMFRVVLTLDVNNFAPEMDFGGWASPKAGDK